MEKRHSENNRLFREHQAAVENIQNTLGQEIVQLAEEYNLSEKEQQELRDYVQDKANLFRYLRKNKFNLATTLSLLVDTLKWRIRHDVDHVNPHPLYEFLQEPLVYFHKTDKTQRPLLVIHLCHFQLDSSLDATEHLTPLFLYVLETARKLIWNMSKERIEKQEKEPLLLETVLLVDFKEASSLPVDRNLLKSLIALLRRYPNMIGTVHLIHFSWIYQGLWQMCKLVLSEEAKSKVNFPKLKDLKQLIPPEDLLETFGGQDGFQYSLENDRYYRLPQPPEDDDDLLRLASRRSSNASIYFDARATLSRTPSFYSTPLGPLTPIGSHANLTRILSMQTIKVPPLTRIEKVSPRPEKKPWLGIVQRTLKRLCTLKGTYYWLFFCIFFRRSIQHLAQHLLLLAITQPWRKRLH
ncbi:CRAL-TRIO domain-containing protein [Sporodiniella umbellata]|nr:CRAL-TRIO domain-containing protein [Sporodiniella umbellata]